MRTVRDIMNPDIISVRSGTTVEALVQLLDEASISGVPVLDSTGKVVGVVSRTDVVRAAAHSRESWAPDSFWEALGTASPATGTDGEGEDEADSAWFLAPESSAWMLPAAAFPELGLGETSVDEIMTPVAFSVDPGMLVWELADFLVRGRIHRALVVEEDRLVGIVTAFDLLRVMAGDAGR
jgi:CBS domain-containing protein